MKKPVSHGHRGHKHFFGTTTMSEKGQLVIPADARKAMGLKSGQKLLVFGMGKNMLAIAKFDQLEKMADSLSERLEGIRAVLKKA